MRPQPTFAPYRKALPPEGKRWLAAGAALFFIVGGISALVHTPERGYGSLLLWICVVGVTGAIVWGGRLLFYRVSMHNAQLYNQEVARVQRQWWERHREHVALKDAVLLGPAGATSTHWHRLVNRDNRQPDIRDEGGGQVIRLLHSFISDTTEREQQLAKMLVLQWCEQRQSEPLLAPLRCYWSGSQAAWRVFLSQMAISFPDVILPENPLHWLGEMSMADIIDELHRSPSEATILCAGCCSLPGEVNSELPAGEAAVLWLLSKEGKVQFSRGEVFDANSDSSVADVAARALLQSELSQPSDDCFLFSQPSISGLDQTGWNVTQYIQDLNWGALAELEPMVVQTLAAISVERKATPCGWMARDTHHSLALGIVKPYGPGN